MLSVLFSSPTTTSRLLSLSLKPFPSPSLSFFASIPTMAINLTSHAFAGNPSKSKTPKPEDPFSPSSALESLKSRLLDNTHVSCSPDFKVLPFLKGRPLASSRPGNGDSTPIWHLGWIGFDDFKGLLGKFEVKLSKDKLVYLGSVVEEDVVYWAIDVSDEGNLVPELGRKEMCFVELRTLMVATNWADQRAMGDLAIAGHVIDLWLFRGDFISFVSRNTFIAILVNVEENAIALFVTRAHEVYLTVLVFKFIFSHHHPNK